MLHIRNRSRFLPPGFNRSTDSWRGRNARGDAVFDVPSLEEFRPLWDNRKAPHPMKNPMAPKKSVITCNIVSNGVVSRYTSFASPTQFGENVLALP